jgi:hypothetical protein
MQTMPGRPRGTRLARALGLDGNPLRRASDRAEAWIRVGLLAIFLIAGPVAAIGAGGWASHAGITGPRVQAMKTHRVQAAVPTPAVTPTYLPGAGKGNWAWARDRSEGAAPSARSGAMLAVVMTLAFMALALLVALQLTRAFLSRRRLAAWEKAWSKVGPRWSAGRP